MRKRPLAFCEVYLSDFAVPASHIEEILINRSAQNSVRTYWHASSVDIAVHAKHANLTARSSSQQKVSPAFGKIVRPVETGVGELADSLFHVVLHARNVIFKFVDVDLRLIGQNQSVARVLWISAGQHVAPRKDCEWSFSYAGVDSCCILSAPNNERIILAKSSKVPTVRTEFQNIDTVHHSFKHGEWLSSFVVPHNHRRFRRALELGSFLTSSKELAV